jgi:hypothetical protein
MSAHAGPIHRVAHLRDPRNKSVNPGTNPERSTATQAVGQRRCEIPSTVGVARILPWPNRRDWAVLVVLSLPDTAFGLCGSVAACVVRNRTDAHEQLRIPLALRR